MPSPGQSAIADIIGAKTYTVEGDFATQFNVDGTFVQKLSTALDSGWTSESPSTPTSMATAFTSELDGYLSGQGMQFLDCVAAGIDQETADWVLSWNSETQVHTYIVTAASIVSRIAVLTGSDRDKSLTQRRNEVKAAVKLQGGFRTGCMLSAVPHAVPGTKPDLPVNCGTMPVLETSDHCRQAVAHRHLGKV